MNSVNFDDLRARKEAEESLRADFENAERTKADAAMLADGVEVLAQQAQLLLKLADRADLLDLNAAAASLVEAMKRLRAAAGRPVSDIPGERSRP